MTCLQSKGRHAAPRSDATTTARTRGFAILPRCDIILQSISHAAKVISCAEWAARCGDLRFSFSSRRVIRSIARCSDQTHVDNIVPGTQPHRAQMRTKPGARSTWRVRNDLSGSMPKVLERTKRMLNRQREALEESRRRVKRRENWRARSLPDWSFKTRQIPYVSHRRGH